MSKFAGGHVPPAPLKVSRRERILGALVILLVAVLMALLVWLSSQAEIAPHQFDYWPLMP
jgi:hypothetical protein